MSVRAPESPAVAPSRRVGGFARTWARARGAVLRLPIEQTSAKSRGFTIEDPRVEQHLDAIGTAFARGYNPAVACVDLSELMVSLRAVDSSHAGFAFEGAAMGLAIGDLFTPGRRFLPRFVQEEGADHEYMCWVGLGWALARLPGSVSRALDKHSSLNKWLALDGYGFHEGFFHWKRTVTALRAPSGLPPGGLHIFDNGLGRSLWFGCGASPRLIQQTIAGFAQVRQADLWAGVGLAATYAGGCSREGLQQLKALAVSYNDALAQGAVFAAEARSRAGNSVSHTLLSCEVLVGGSVAAAADMARECRPRDGTGLSDYQSWRMAIQQRFRARP